MSKQEINQLMLDKIQNLEVDCPECENQESDIYDCKTCGSTDGYGRINVLEFMKKNIELIAPIEENLSKETKEQFENTVFTFIKKKRLNGSARVCAIGRCTNLRQILSEFQHFSFIEKMRKDNQKPN